MTILKDTKKAKKPTLSEAAKEIFDSNLSGKASGKDGTKKLEPTGEQGAVKDAGGDTPEKHAECNPDTAAVVSKDGSKASVSQVAGDKATQKLTTVPEGEEPKKDAPVVAEGDNDTTKTDDNDDVVAEDATEITKEPRKPIEIAVPTNIDMKEHVDALFAGEGSLSEEFKKKAQTVFEAAVKSKLAEIVKAINEAAEKAVLEEVAAIKEDVEKEVEEALTYVAEQWLADNEVAIESNLRSELTEDFIGELRTLFVKHNIDIPEEKIDVVNEMAAELETVKDQLNEAVQKNVAITATLFEAKKAEIVDVLSEGLTDTEAEKLVGLCKDVKAVTEKEFAEKAKTIRESYFTGKDKNLTESAKDALKKASDVPSTPVALDEEAVPTKEELAEEEKKAAESAKPTNPSMARYTKMLTKQLH